MISSTIKDIQTIKIFDKIVQNQQNQNRKNMELPLIILKQRLKTFINKQFKVTILLKINNNNKETNTTLLNNQT